MTDLMREAHEIDQESLLIERFKIEDEIYSKFEIDIEHIIQIQREIEAV